jgi:hypothetical protein
LAILESTYDPDVTPESYSHRMTSPWALFEPALGGAFGHRIRRAVSTAVASVAIVSLFWPAPLLWMIHSLVAWKTHDLQEQLRHILQQGRRR